MMKMLSESEARQLFQGSTRCPAFRSRTVLAQGGIYA
jgi:hypothetical protein